MVRTVSFPTRMGRYLRAMVKRATREMDMMWVMASVWCMKILSSSCTTETLIRSRCFGVGARESKETSEFTPNVIFSRVKRAMVGSRKVALTASLKTSCPNVPPVWDHEPVVTL